MGLSTVRGTKVTHDSSSGSAGVFDAPEAYAGELAILFTHGAVGHGGRGIFFMPASAAETADVCEMAVSGRGVVTVSISNLDATRLALKPQGGIRQGNAPYSAMSVEAAACSETGISAAERALTMRMLGDPASTIESVVTPGHIMVQVVPDPFRKEPTLPEIAYRLTASKLDLGPVGWCDILGEDGELADLDRCRELVARLSAPLYLAADVIDYTEQAGRLLDPFQAFTYSSFM